MGDRPITVAPEVRLPFQDSRRRFLYGAAGLLAGLNPVAAAFDSPQRLFINTAFGPPISTPQQNGFFDRLMQQVFGRLGYAVTIQAPPAERALMLADHGIDDGDGPRIPSLEGPDFYPNLLPVPESILNIDFVAFTLSLRFATDNWESLRPYTVAIVTGWKILERNIRDTTALIRVKDPEHLFLLLKSGRTEVAVIDSISGLATARHVGIPYFNILSPPLARTPMYLYMHRRHAALAAKAGQVLREIKHDGTYALLQRETLNHVFDYHSDQ